MAYRFTLTPEIVRYLQTIERIREALRHIDLSQEEHDRLRFRTQLHTTHYSTRIEGNRLTLKQTEGVLEGSKSIVGHERDMHEVRLYYNALKQVDEWVDEKSDITEKRIQLLHARLFYGKEAEATPYRDGQNAVTDENIQVIYWPPKAGDVPTLMHELIEWINKKISTLPVPVIAGIAHYQFATIHPYNDGNGRAARLLTSWILKKGGYGLEGLHVLEKFYVDDLQSYYDALKTHPEPDYYSGRHQADITPWITYFLKGIATTLETLIVTLEEDSYHQRSPEHLALLRPLDPRARQILRLFVTQDLIQSSDVAELLGLSTRQARDLIAGWVEQGWLEVANPSKKGRTYRLAEAYRGLVQ